MKCGVLCSPQSHTTLVPACRAPCAACTHPGICNLLTALGPQTQASSLQQGPAPGQRAAHPQHQHLKVPRLWGWAGRTECHGKTDGSREDLQGRKTLLYSALMVPVCQDVIQATQRQA